MDGERFAAALRNRIRRVEAGEDGQSPFWRGVAEGLREALRTAEIAGEEGPGGSAAGPQRKTGGPGAIRAERQP